jgi:hypothetical protein
MAITHERISITTTATLLSATVSGRDGQTLMIQNPSAGSVTYLGGAGVTSTSYGYALSPGSDMSIDLANGETLYGIVASSTNTVNVIRQGA